MNRRTDGAERARTLLERSAAPLSAECERVLERDLRRVLSAYFELEGAVELRVGRCEKIEISVRAQASRARPFGVLG